jgi:prophage regulatory protein
MKKIVGFNDLPQYGIKWSRVHVSRLEKEGKFPKHLNLAPQSIGWLEEEILAWIDERAAARSRGNAADPAASAEARKSENAALFSDAPDEAEHRRRNEEIGVGGASRRGAA